ncbi:hypothetical protein D3C75_1338410 [compost metagenome]
MPIQHAIDHVLRHLVQRLALELTALLFRLGKGVVGAQLPVFGDLPTGGHFDTAHIGFIHVDAVTDEIISGVTDGAGRIL